MASESPTVAAHATAVLHAALRSRGFELGDFRVRVDTAPEWAQSFGVPSGLIKVRCRSTGEERPYSIGSGSAWLGAFMTDLAGGHFARAARVRREPAPRVARRSLLQRLCAGGRDWVRALDAGRALALTPPPLTSPP